MGVLHDNTSRIQGLIADISSLPKDRYEAGLEEGYDDGYSEGYEVGKSDGYTEGYDKGIAEAKLNVSSKETLTFSKLVDANMTVLYTSNYDVEVVRLAGTRGGVGTLPVIELYDDDTLIFSGSASQSMEYIDLLPLCKNHSLRIKKTGGDDYTGSFTLKTIKISLN